MSLVFTLLIVNVSGIVTISEGKLISTITIIIFYVPYFESF